jgi:hypothetical protein
VNRVDLPSAVNLGHRLGLAEHVPVFAPAGLLAQLDAVT